MAPSIKAPEPDLATGHQAEEEEDQRRVLSRQPILSLDPAPELLVQPLNHVRGSERLSLALRELEERHQLLGREYSRPFAVLKLYQGQSMCAKGEIANRCRFETCVLVHLDDLYRAALRLTGKPSDAEDLVQETCLRAFQRLDQLRHTGAAKAWVFAILRSLFLRQAERRAVQPISVSSETLDVLARAEDRLGALQERSAPLQASLLQELRWATLELPLPYREVIVLAHVGGFSYRDMSNILEIPLGTVMSRLFRARRLLRIALEGVIELPSHTEPAR